MNAEIISIGDELLTGQKVNTNAASICSGLAAIGIGVDRIIVCADREDAIIRQFSDSLDRSDIVLVTGGLGPTKDDRTRNAAAALLNARMVFDESTYNRSLQRYAASGNVPTQGLRENAMVIEGATVIANSCGLAPGMILTAGPEFDNHVLVLMPGVPSEMEAMMRNTVIPWFSGRSGSVIHHSHIMTTGAGETTIARRIVDIEESLPDGTTLAYLPHQAGVSLRVSTTGKDRDNVERANSAVVEAICKAVPELVYATREVSLEAVIGKLLLERGFTVSTAESCTGGLIASRLTDVAGSSAYFQRGYIVYSNASKQEMLGVSGETLERFGAVSEEVAGEMARGCLDSSKADLSISATGIAGPGGEMPGKPLGMVCLGLAVRQPDGSPMVHTTTFCAHGDRLRNKYRFSEAALRLLWQELISSR
ncbi:CinA family nicotinamide mononucleotide deamidase-related protein [Prosthecochloris sp. HL-130-GSB]|jgi:nicotinamide-nucleotide amidase|uniref:CinA-like protein n=1 Tax=Prosthecochloris aestuarii TaxID=1102 RepID=A0A831SLU5_PROAE|nr:CinA family nicotinamide mononucleotide deamidase-related protein [Prosthecochloris sp. HL-130-GSB]ARM30194.1 damage-inducible protein CinA [Prosthecochloris sp. HL-130-GSB]HED30642.1 CinA family nicotinamide mononucleotide deamidase-related protein [Prosthecochloris aestuarii]